MSKIQTWRTQSAEDYYYEADINERIETAYERAYQAQCRRELAIWERRRQDSNPQTPNP